MELTGKSAVITGGLGGIAIATAKKLLEDYGIVNVALLDLVENEETITALKEAYPNANILFQAVDVSKLDDVERSFQNIIHNFKEINLILSSAGVLDEENADLCIRVNLVGTINLTQTAMKYMSKESGGTGGTIVNIASVAGISCSAGIPIYIASKHGVVAFTRSMAEDYYFSKSDVKFICVCPGATATSMIAGAQKFPLVIREAMRKMKGQSADDCGKCIANIAATAANGSLWIVESANMKQFSMNNYWEP